jgi:hypothetical protein
VHAQEIIERGRTQQTYPFDWSLKLYQAPPVMGPKDLSVSEEELSLVEAKLMDKARKRLAEGMYTLYIYKRNFENLTKKKV